MLVNFLVSLGVTRDSLLITFSVVATILGYLVVSPKPTTWDYYETLQFLIFLTGVAVARLGNSPLPSKKELNTINYNKENQ